MKTKKLILMLISLLASMLLWLYVVTVVSPETTKTFYNIPVTFVGEDTLREDGLTISEGADATVTLRLTGTRSIIDNQLDMDNITISVDVSKIRSAGEYTRSYTISYPNSIQPSSVKVESKNPNNINFIVEELESKEVPVKPVFEGSLEDGYTLKSLKSNFDTITVTGTAEQIAPISKAMVIVDEKGMHQSTTRTMNYTFVDENGDPVDTTGIEVDEESVELTISIVKHKTLPLTVDFVAGGGATEDNVKWEFDPATITVSGDEEILDSLNRISLGTLDLSTVVADSELNYPIVLPEGVENETGEAEATLTLTLSGLSSKTLRVSNFEFTNEPDGYHVSAMTQSLQISVRGPSDEIERITAGNVRVVADLSSISGVAGNYTCENVTIYLDGFPNSGVMGSYSVAVNLMTQEDYLAALAEDSGG